MARPSKRYAQIFSVVWSLLLVNLAYAGVGGYERGPVRVISGEVIFRGLFFGNGPVANMFPEIWGSPQLATYASRLNDPDVLALEDRLIERLRADNPGFFVNFAQEMRSGDQLRIQDAMRYGAERLKFAVMAETGITPEAALADPTTNVGTLVAVVLALALAVLVAAVAVLVWVEFDIAQNRDMYAGTGSPNGLRSEMYIQMISDRLAMAE